MGNKTNKIEKGGGDEEWGTSTVKIDTRLDQGQLAGVEAIRQVTK